MNKHRNLQSKIVRQTGVCQSVISDIFNGKRRATPQQAALLEAEFLKRGINITRWDMLYRHQKGQKLLDLDANKKPETIPAVDVLS